MLKSYLSVQVVCRVSFTNQGGAEAVLAWATAQIHCFATVNHNKA